MNEELLQEIIEMLSEIKTEKTLRAIYYLVSCLWKKESI